MAKRQKKADDQSKVLREKTKRAVLAQMLPHLGTWVKTLAELSVDGEDEKTRAGAAKAGLSLALHFIPEDDPQEGDELLKLLSGMEKLAGNEQQPVPDVFRRDFE